MVMNRIACDFCMALLFVYNLDSLNTRDLCHGTWAVALAFFIQTSFIAGEGWFVAIAVDPVLSIVRPFFSSDGKRKVYKCVVYVVALCYGILFLVTADKGGIGSSHTFSNVCWVTDGHGMHKNFVYYPVVFVCVVAACALFIVWRALHIGLERTLLTRTHVLKNSLAFVAIYFFYYGVCAAVVFI